MDDKENLAKEVEEIEQTVNALVRSVDKVLYSQSLILQQLLAQSEILKKILTEVVPTGPGLASTQKINLEPPK